MLQPLAKKRILLGITGGIAAYKSADLVRRLREVGAEIQVAMTPAATTFVAPLTFQAVSGRPVHTELLDVNTEAGMGHIELARWADLILIAPATADFLARLAQGMANDLLSTLCLATSAYRRRSRDESADVAKRRYSGQLSATGATRSKNLGARRR